MRHAFQNRFIVCGFTFLQVMVGIYEADRTQDSRPAEEDG